MRKTDRQADEKEREKRKEVFFTQITFGFNSQRYVLQIILFSFLILEIALLLTFPESLVISTKLDFFVLFCFQNIFSMFLLKKKKKKKPSKYRRLHRAQEELTAWRVSAMRTHTLNADKGSLHYAPISKNSSSSRDL